MKNKTFDTTIEKDITDFLNTRYRYIELTNAHITNSTLNCNDYLLPNDIIAEEYHDFVILNKKTNKTIKGTISIILKDD